MAPFETEVGPPIGNVAGAVLDVWPDEGFIALTERVRSAIRTTRGAAALQHNGGRPHLPYAEKHTGRQRLCLNLGPGTRYIILGNIDAQAVCRAVHPADSTQRYPHTDDYRSYVASGRSIRVDPPRSRRGLRGPHRVPAARRLHRSREPSLGRRVLARTVALRHPAIAGLPLGDQKGRTAVQTGRMWGAGGRRPSRCVFAPG